jgi:hypothetical protein
MAQTAPWEGLLKVAEKGLNCGRKEIEPRLELLREEALTRLDRLREQARRDGVELLAIAAREGIDLARECGLPLIGKARRRRSRWGWLAAGLAVAAVAGVLVAAARD